MSLTPPADFLKYAIGSTSNNYTIGDPTPFNIPIGGAIISPHLTGIFNRYEGQVTINFKTCTNNATTSSTIYTGTNVIPTRYLPSMPTYCNISVLNNNLVKLGTVRILPTGLMEFFVEGHTDFDDAGQCGILKGSVTYAI